jgi:hypothetical protein
MQASRSHANCATRNPVLCRALRCSGIAVRPLRGVLPDLCKDSYSTPAKPVRSLPASEAHECACMCVIAVVHNA